MDVGKFLAELHSELEQIERQIQLLEQLDVPAQSSGPGLSMCAPGSFRADTVKAKPGGDRFRWLQ